jgi:hypothetical protein
MAGHEVHMSVPKFFQYFGQYLEELLFGHIIGQAVAVTAIHFVPIEAVFLILIVEETILGVDDAPQGFEVSFWIVLGDVLGDAGREKEEC